MKILTLRFANLNSLQGEWQIDFTRPEYVADGLFAITGPTGSGKSTILDAICLALYGETPRLRKITASSNEIMSRHAGECFAEVIFATDSGTFRCTWSQHRSRRKPGGALQPQKHEIADAATGVLIQSKVQETRQEVEARTGMDFDRFTRSMLLAQGGFAAFLQADADQRAPVLEQITGTEIYSLISMKVHERKRAEQELLQRLEIEAGGIRLLGPEALAELETERSDLLNKERELSASLKSDSAALHWLEEVAQLEEAVASTIIELEALEGERSAFSADADRLDRARVAALAEAAYADVQRLREELRRSAEELAARELQRPEAERRAQEANAAHEAAGRSLELATQTIESAKPLVLQARRLDEQIANSSREAGRLKQEHDELEARREQLQRERTESSAALESTRSALQALRVWQDEHRIDASISRALSGIRHALDELRPAAEREAAAASAIADLQRGLVALQDELALAEAEALESKSLFDASRTALDELKASFTVQLDGATLKGLRGEFDRLRERHLLLQQIANLYTEGKQFPPKIEAIKTNIQDAERRRYGLSQKLDHARQLLELAEREAAAQEEIARLADRVRSLEEERHRLVDGKPCPLCGSLHHPYVDERGAVPNRDDQALQAVRVAVRERDVAVRKGEIALAETGKEIEESVKRQNDLVELYTSSGRRCLALLKEAGIDAPPREAEPVVSDALQLAASQRDALAERIEQLERLEQQIRDDEAELLQRHESAQSALRRYERATEQHRALRLELARSEKELDEARRNLAKRQQYFLNLLTPFGVSTVDDPSIIVAALEERSEVWMRNDAQLRNLEQEQLAVETRLSNFDQQLVTIELDCAARRRSVESAITSLEALKAERSGLFGGNSADAEQARLEAALQECRIQLDVAVDARNAAREALSVLDSTIAGLRQTSRNRRAELDEREAAFITELRQRGFDGEAAFLEARLDLAERQRLEALADSIDKRLLELEARRKERQMRLEEAQQRRLTTESGEVLAKRIAQRQEELRQLGGRVGEIEGRLRDNGRAAEEHRLKLQAVEARKREYRRWELLHELIGSADGKKFRNFAQGITFELMIQNANRQLRQMTDRYELLHNPNQPLELSVIDLWQAGEIRSTRNLSGGESFIVSLALALGLSQMSSRNVRVDSLFLDEGFGTLDDEALETALETLAGLQRSSKLIGVISHVAALRERIATHILVKPQTGGRSIIEGPGVTAVSSA